MFFSFWLISLCMTDSRSIHITTNDAISLLFYDWVIFHCIYVQHLLYPFISLWACLSMNFNLHFYTSEKENLFNIWIKSVFSFLWTLSSDPLPMPIFLFICWIFSFSFFFFLSSHHVESRILIPWPEIETVPPALGAWSLNH